MNIELFYQQLQKLHKFFSNYSGDEIIKELGKRYNSPAYVQEIKMRYEKNPLLFLCTHDIGLSLIEKIFEKDF